MKLRWWLAKLHCWLENKSKHYKKGAEQMDKIDKEQVEAMRRFARNDVM